MLQEFQSMSLKSHPAASSPRSLRFVLTHLDGLLEVVLFVQALGNAYGVRAHGVVFVVSEIEENVEKSLAHVHPTQDQIAKGVHAELTTVLSKNDMWNVILPSNRQTYLVLAVSFQHE